MDIVKIQDLEAINASDDLLMLVEQPNGTIGRKLTVEDLKNLFTSYIIPQNWRDVSYPEIFSSSSYIFGIAYGLGEFIAVGSGGRWGISLDGINWKSKGTLSNFSNSAIRSIAFAAEGFVAVGDNGAISVCRDGKTWSNVFDDIPSNFGSSRIKAVASGGNMFLAGGLDGKIGVSTNGSLWTLLSDATSIFGTATINAIASGNGKWVIGGSQGKMAYCFFNDPYHLTEIVQSNLSYINAIAYGNGIWVAGGSQGKMAYSLDGVTWTAISQNVFPYDVTSIAYGNGMFVAVGKSAAKAYSLDGINWFPMKARTYDPVATIEVVAFGDGKFVTGQYGGNIAVLY